MESLREFRALVDRAGGRQRLLLVTEAAANANGVGPSAGGSRASSERAPRLLLETFARELFDERQQPETPPPGKEAAAPSPSSSAARRRVPRGAAASSSGWPWRGCALLFVLFDAASLLPPRWARERRRLREILSDVRARMRSRAGAPPAVVGVVLLPAAAAAAVGPASNCASAEGADAARGHLEALLRRVFGQGRREQQQQQRPETLQVAAYCPGRGPRGAAEARDAACRALRAALKLRADGAEAEKQQVSSFLHCFLWPRRKKHREGNAPIPVNDLSEDGQQDPEEGVALINMAANGNCEGACEGVVT